MVLYFYVLNMMNVNIVKSVAVVHLTYVYIDIDNYNT